MAMAPCGGEAMGSEGDPACGQPSCKTRSQSGASPSLGGWDLIPCSPGGAGAAGGVPRVGFGAGGEEGRTR